MIKQAIFILILLLLQSSCEGQASPGPKLIAMGMNTAAVDDHFNVHSNPVHILAAKSPTFALGYVKFSVAELSEQIFNAIWPVGLNNIAISAYRYGIDVFHELEVGLTVARRFNDLRIGVKANYHQLVIANYGSTKYASADVGIAYVFDSLCTVGLYAARFGGKNREYESNNLANKLSIGFAYQMSDKVLIAANASHTNSRKIDCGLGIEFRFAPQFCIRGGLTVNPFKQYAGIGLIIKKLTVDLALAAVPLLTHNLQIGISYAL